MENWAIALTALAVPFQLLSSNLFLEVTELALLYFILKRSNTEILQLQQVKTLLSHSPISSSSSSPKQGRATTPTSRRGETGKTAQQIFPETNIKQTKT